MNAAHNHNQIQLNGDMQPMHSEQVSKFLRKFIQDISNDL